MSDLSENTLWFCIEKEIERLAIADLEAKNLEATTQDIARRLDSLGLNVSRTGGSFLLLRRALDARITVGTPLLTELNAAVNAMSLQDVTNTRAAAVKVQRNLAPTWPVLIGAEYVKGIEQMVADRKLKLLIDQTMNSSPKEAIRLLRQHHVSKENIMVSLGLDEPNLDHLETELAAEQAEVDRVTALLETVSGKPQDEQIKHLLENDATDALITQLLGAEQSSINPVKDLIKREKEEAARKQLEEATKKAAEEARKAAEEAARKQLEEAERKAAAAAAPAPSVDDIPNDELLEHIEAIREILDFADDEKQLRVMCEQSAIPQILVDIAASDPDKLDELEEKAES